MADQDSGFTFSDPDKQDEVEGQCEGTVSSIGTLGRAAVASRTGAMLGGPDGEQKRPGPPTGYLSEKARETLRELLSGTKPSLFAHTEQSKRMAESMEIVATAKAELTECLEAGVDKIVREWTSRWGLIPHIEIKFRPDHAYGGRDANGQTQVVLHDISEAVRL